MQLLQASVDGTRIPPAQQLVDAAGAVWTLSGRSILRNGVYTNGQGTILAWCGAQVWTYGGDQHWWIWTNGSWLQSGTTDPCPGTPPPAGLKITPHVVPVVQTLQDPGGALWGTFTLTGYSIGVLPVDMAGFPATGPPLATFTVSTVPTNTVQINGDSYFSLPLTPDLARSLTQTGPVGQWYRAGVAWRGYSTAAGTTQQDPSASAFAYADRWFRFDLPTNTFVISGEVIKGQGKPPQIQDVRK